jgi:Na+/H+ antiporter
MQNGGIQQVELVFLLLLLFVAVFGYIAQKLKLPYPIVLVIAGTLLGFVPGIPKVTLNPDLIFLVVLPPLLYSAAWLTSWREFSYNMFSILFLAFGLVAFTVFGVAYGTHWVFPGFDWASGFVLGAVIAPTDAIAATSIAKRVGMPKQIVDLLEGESLVNDATGLLALEFGIAMVIYNQRPSVSEGIFRLAYLVVVGIAVGLVAGWVVYYIEKRIENAPIEIALSIFIPYAVYLTANRLHASGVFAVIVCGLFLGRKSSYFFSASVRLQASAVWDSLTFILNGLVFVLVGLQLPYVLAGIHEYSMRQLLVYGAFFSLFVILLRIVWVFPGAYVARWIRAGLLKQKRFYPKPRGILVVGWTGMRGAVSLAAAISLPQVLENGQPYAYRNIIIFLTFSVIFVTLVLQGLTLPALVRWLRFPADSEEKKEEESARREMLQAALAHLRVSREAHDDEFAAVYDDLENHYGHRLHAVSEEEGEKPGDSAKHRKHTDLIRELLTVERQTVVRLRNEDRINDETLRQLEHELDLRESSPDQAI